MSRIGKQPIIIPAGVEVTVDNNHVTVKGPKGDQSFAIHPHVIINRQDDVITIDVKDHEEKFQKSLWGLSRRLISNAVDGVTQGFTKKLEINGVGYKAEMKGDILHLQLGFSHPIDYSAPAGITITVEKNAVTITGVDKQQVGQVAADIRAFKKPEPYKGKGIKYSDEVIRRKAGKAAAKGA